MDTFKKLVVGANWKIYMKSFDQVRNFVKILRKQLDKYDTDKVEAYILPDFVSLKVLVDSLDDFPVYTGTQDIFWEDYGPFTGEVSPMLIADLGCRFTFIGHSERKKYFGENDISINKKVLACYRNNIIPIVLVGEDITERKSGKTMEVLKRQLNIALKGIPPSFMRELVVAYEPVWAIGQKDSAPLDDIEESHKIVRNIISGIYDTNTAKNIRIIYGGSVNLENGSRIIKISEVDGLAITRAALDPVDFAQFIKLIEDEALKRS